MQVFWRRELPSGVTDTCAGTSDTMIWAEGMMTALGERIYCDRFREAVYYLRIKHHPAFRTGWPKSSFRKTCTNFIANPVIWVRLRYINELFFFFFAFLFSSYSNTHWFFQECSYHVIQRKACLIFFETSQELLTTLLIKYQYDNTFSVFESQI